MNVKTCSRCQQEKPREAFSPHPGTRSGLQSHCKACKAEAIRHSRNGGRPPKEEPQPGHKRCVYTDCSRPGKPHPWGYGFTFCDFHTENLEKHNRSKSGERRKPRNGEFGVCASCAQTKKIYVGGVCNRCYRLNRAKQGDCADCGQHKVIRGRGLCAACHSRHRYAHTLDQFPMKRKARS